MEKRKQKKLNSNNFFISPEALSVANTVVNNLIQNVAVLCARQEAIQKQLKPYTIQNLKRSQLMLNEQSNLCNQIQNQVQTDIQFEPQIPGKDNTVLQVQIKYRESKKDYWQKISQNLGRQTVLNQYKSSQQNSKWNGLLKHKQLNAEKKSNRSSVCSGEQSLTRLNASNLSSLPDNQYVKVIEKQNVEQDEIEKECNMLRKFLKQKEIGENTLRQNNVLSIQPQSVNKSVQEKPQVRLKSAIHTPKIKTQLISTFVQARVQNGFFRQESVENRENRHNFDLDEPNRKFKRNDENINVLEHQTHKTQVISEKQKLLTQISNNQGTQFFEAYCKQFKVADLLQIQNGVQLTELEMKPGASVLGTDLSSKEQIQTIDQFFKVRNLISGGKYRNQRIDTATIQKQMSLQEYRTLSRNSIHSMNQTEASNQNSQFLQQAATSPKSDLLQIGGESIKYSSLQDKQQKRPKTSEGHRMNIGKLSRNKTYETTEQIANLLLTDNKFEKHRFNSKDQLFRRSIQPLITVNSFKRRVSINSMNLESGQLNQDLSRVLHHSNFNKIAD